jgi:hypothetical protein
MIVLVSSSASPWSIDSGDPYKAARAVRSSSELTGETLMSIYERFGGRKAFMAKKVEEPMRELLGALLRSKSFPEAEHMAIFDGMTKIGRYDTYAFSRKAYVAADFDRFMKLWKTDKSAAITFADELSRYRDPDFENEESPWVELPMIHAFDCRGDQPGYSLAHYSCKEPRLYKADLNLKLAQAYKAKLVAAADPKVIDFIQEHIFECSERMRAKYAGSFIVRDDHWESLADDKRSVLNAVAGNALIPTRVAEGIVLRHKTPALRESIAKYTTDNDLLNLIWSGTKSASIQEAVESNPLFKPLQ